MNCCEHERKVVVIGGGISGVGAARTLHAAGFRPLILESRDRLGGRICKAQIFPNLSPNQDENAGNYINVQFGANWIHGLNEGVNPMYHYAKKMGLLLHQTSSDDEPGDDVLLFDPEAEAEGNAVCGTVPKEEYEAVLQRYEWIKGHFEESAAHTVLDAFEDAIAASEEVFGPVSALHRRCLNWFLDRVAIDMGSSLDNVDKATYIEGDSEGAFGEAVVHGGMSRIFESLAAEYPLDVRLGVQVVAIDWTPSTDGQSGRKVTVRCANGDVYHADGCILTAPLGTLGAITFTPHQPAAVTSLLKALRPSLMNLVWLWFPKRFWPEGYNFFGLARPKGSMDKVAFTTFLAPPIFDAHGVQQPVLMCQIVGPYAIALEDLEDKEIAQAAVEVLKGCFSDLPDPIGCGHSAWKSEIYSQGSWSLFPLSADDQPEEEDLPPLAPPSECLLYAGEAVAVDHRGTVHGAFKSGILQAERMIAHLLD